MRPLDRYFFFMFGNVSKAKAVSGREEGLSPPSAMVERVVRRGGEGESEVKC